MGKKRSGSQRWRKQTLRLKDNHTWNAPEGYKIVVIDRGAASFNIPQNWIIAKYEPLELHDKEPPDDNARLSVSLWQFPPGIDWTGLPLAPLLAQSIEGSELKILSQTEIATLPREDIEIVWTERRFDDPVEHREAFSRIALARGFDVTILMTFDVWEDDRAKFLHVWDEAIRSLQLGRRIEDPTKGATLH